MPPTVYIETTIPSFYYEVRTEPDMISRRRWKRQWWDNTAMSLACYQCSGLG